MNNQKKHIIRIPTIVDPHMHYRDLGEYNSGTIYSESMSSLEGGVTSGLIMPNTSPPLDTLHIFNKYYNIVNTKSNLDVTRLTVLGTRTLIKQPQTHIDNMCEKAYGVKLFLNKSHVKTENMAYEPDIWVSLFKKIPISIKFFIHVEEGEKLSEFLTIAKDYNYHYHICHVHTREILDLIIEYRKKYNMCITCEVCPHHLLEICLGCCVKPSPTSTNDIHYLIKNIQHIDCLATDHAPHINPENYGIASTEFTLQIYMTLVKKGILSLERMIKMACINPRILLDIKDLYEDIDSNGTYVLPIILEQVSNFNLEDILSCFSKLKSNYLIVDTDYEDKLPLEFKYSKGVNSIYFGMPSYGKIKKISRLNINNITPTNIDNKYI